MMQVRLSFGSERVSPVPRPSDSFHFRSDSSLASADHVVSCELPRKLAVVESERECSGVWRCKQRLPEIALAVEEIEFHT